MHEHQLGGLLRRFGTLGIEGSRTEIEVNHRFFFSLDFFFQIGEHFRMACFLGLTGFGFGEFPLGSVQFRLADSFDFPALLLFGQFAEFFRLLAFSFGLGVLLAALFSLRRPLVVGLTTAPERLVQVRRNRLLSLNEATETAYVDSERVRAEVQFARRMFADNGWPVIDVTRRSIEETAAAVIRLHGERDRQGDASEPGMGPV